MSTFEHRMSMRVHIVLKDRLCRTLFNCRRSFMVCSIAHACSFVVLSLVLTEGLKSRIVSPNKKVAKKCHNMGLVGRHLSGDTCLVGRHFRDFGPLIIQQSSREPTDWAQQVVLTVVIHVMTCTVLEPWPRRWNPPDLCIVAGTKYRWPVNPSLSFISTRTLWLSTNRPLFP